MNKKQVYLLYHLLAILLIEGLLDRNIRKKGRNIEGIQYVPFRGKFFLILYSDIVSSCCGIRLRLRRFAMKRSIEEDRGRGRRRTMAYCPPKTYSYSNKRRRSRRRRRRWRSRRRRRTIQRRVIDIAATKPSRRHGKPQQHMPAAATTTTTRGVSYYGSCWL